MPFIPVPNTWEVRVEQSLASVRHPVNVFHVSNGGSPLGQTQADQVAEAVENAYEVLAAFLTTNWSIDSIQVTDLTTSSSPQFNGVFDALVGTDATEMLPLQTAGLIEWATALRGPAYRGKTFLAGFCEDTSNVNPTAGTITAMGGFAGAMLTNLAAVGRPMCVVSRFLGKHENPDGTSNRRFVPSPRAAGIATPITTWSVEDVWKTQRRRAVPG